MGATNSTTNYSLSQFVSTDKPAWLQDYNGDMLKIDTAVKTVSVAADTAQTTANSASSAASTNASAISSLQTTVSGLNSSVTSLQSSVNTIQSLIGNGTPTTTDHTIIGAINEINAYRHLKKVGRLDVTSASTQKALYDLIYNYLNANFGSAVITGLLVFSSGREFHFFGPDGGQYQICAQGAASASIILNAMYATNGTSDAGYYRISQNGTITYTDTKASANTNTYVDVYVNEN